MNVKDFKNANGITLISLVITIIVILILAVIAVSMTIGNNGIINKAQNAKSTMSLIEIEEEANLEYASLKINDYADGENQISIVDLVNKLSKKYQINNVLNGEESVYYILINGEYYPMSIQNEKVIIGNVPTSSLPIPSETSEANSEISFSTAYGKIDVIWLDTSNNVKSSPNTPELYNNAMEKVTWSKSGDTWTEDSTAKNIWYNYNKISGTNDNLTSMWANAKNTDDGSYFVWIPRYAYRITYYSSNLSTTPTGFYDGWGMWKAEDGSVKYALDNGIETVEYNGNKYIVHPAFETNLENGGWSTDLSGFWVSKYEMSKENYESGNWVPNGTNNFGGGDILITDLNKDTIRMVSKPSTEIATVSSWRASTIGKIYSNVFSYDRNKESHLMKNSEWGAVAYLAYSSYGRNGYEMNVNNNSDYLTGNGGNSIAGNTEESQEITNYYNTTNGAKSSTTGNIYGVYDMIGGSWEYVAAFNSADTNSKISSNGWSGLSTSSSSTKYATKYNNADNTLSIYSISKIGDAQKEVIIENTNSWFNSYCKNVTPANPFLVRGAHYRFGEAGIFCGSNVDGGIDGARSFRAVLCP